MKVAFCLFGLSGKDEEQIIMRSPDSEKKNGISYEIMQKSYEQYKKFIFDVNKDIDIDVFLHTRYHSNVEKIKEMYKPKYYQIDHIDDISFLKDVRTVPHLDNIAFISKWDSIIKVLNLVKETCETYDYIFLCRFDLYFLKPFDYLNNHLENNELMFAQNDLWLINGTEFEGFGNEAHNNEYMKGNYEIKKMPEYHVCDNWMLLKTHNINAIIETGTVHSNLLKKYVYCNALNIHYFIATYLRENCKCKIKTWESMYYTSFTRCRDTL